MKRIRLTALEIEVILATAQDCVAYETLSDVDERVFEKRMDAYESALDKLRAMLALAEK